MKRPTHLEMREGRTGFAPGSDYIQVPFYSEPVPRPVPVSQPSLLEKIQSRYHQIRVEASWKRLERKIRSVLRRLTDQELKAFPDYFYYHQQKELWMIKPDVDQKIQRKIAPLVSETGSVPGSVTLIAKDVFLEEFERRGLL